MPQDIAHEKLSTTYDQLIELINENVPVISEPFQLFGQEFTATHIIIPVVILILASLIGNLLRSLLINKTLPRHIDDRKTILSIGNTTKYTTLIIGLTIVFSTVGLGSDSDLNVRLFGNAEDDNEI